MLKVKLCSPENQTRPFGSSSVCIWLGKCNWLETTPVNTDRLGFTHATWALCDCLEGWRSAWVEVAEDWDHWLTVLLRLMRYLWKNPSILSHPVYVRQGQSEYKAIKHVFNMQLKMLWHRTPWGDRLWRLRRIWVSFPRQNFTLSIASLWPTLILHVLISLGFSQTNRCWVITQESTAVPSPTSSKPISHIWRSSAQGPGCPRPLCATSPNSSQLTGKPFSTLQSHTCS